MDRLFLLFSLSFISLYLYGQELIQDNAGTGANQYGHGKPPHPYGEAPVGAFRNGAVSAGQPYRCDVFALFQPAVQACTQLIRERWSASGRLCRMVQAFRMERRTDILVDYL